MQLSRLISWLWLPRFSEVNNLLPHCFQSFQQPWVPISNNIWKSNIRTVFYITYLIVPKQTHPWTSIMCLWEVIVYLTLLSSMGISQKEDHTVVEHGLEHGRFRRELTLTECKEIQAEMIFWRKAFICTISPIIGIVLVIIAVAIMRCMTRNRPN